MKTIQECGVVALEAATQLFLRDVTNPRNADTTGYATHSRDVINDILRECGWTWSEVYPYHGTVQYCCMFAGKCWKDAGLDPKWLITFFAGTERLDAWASYKNWNEHVNPGPIPGAIPTWEWRQVANYDAHSTTLKFDPLPGDIVLIGDGDPAPGDHCTVLESYNPVTKTFTHISGNGVGTGPDGRRRMGIVRGTSKLGGPGFCVRRVIRPSIHDIIQ